jgi:hypothetical protein
MPIEIINPIPAEILAGGSGGGNYGLSTDAFDIAIDGQPFILATNDQRPMTREVPDINKQKFDNFAEPGEYSLQDWWLRSQEEWGGGQGLLYQDPSVDQRFNIKYNLSKGINVWKPGEISLLPDGFDEQRTELVGDDEPLSFTGGYFDIIIPHAWYTAGDSLYDMRLDDLTTVDVAYSGADPKADIVAFTTFGDRYYVATTSGIYSGVGNGAGTKIWNNTSSDVVLGWAKGRLMAGIDNAVYELVGAGPALPTAKFTHLDADWVWKSIAEGPTSIYVAGSSYPDSAIYKFVLETDGAVPTLSSGGTVAATMPPGELVNTTYCYLGTFLGIATNRGFRVGVVDAQGDIAFGPLLWEKYSRGVLGDDRFFYVGVTGGIDLDPDIPDATASTFYDTDTIHDQYLCDGIYRVDLGQELQSSQGASLRYAYSTDRFLSRPSDPADPEVGQIPLQSITMVGDRFIFAIYREDSSLLEDGYRVYWPTDREEIEVATPPDSIAGSDPHYPKMVDGYLQTGRVRYNTLEPKTFRFFSVRSPSPFEGSLDVDVIDENEGVVRYITYNSAHPPDVGDIPLTAHVVPMNYISLRFTFHRDEVDTHLAAIMNGWQLKAMPAPIRMREYTLTVLCFDTEQDKTGQEIGYEGYALERLQRLEQTAQRGNVVTLQDLYNDIAAQVIIQQMQFAQFAPPGPVSRGYGGYITLRMKTVSDVIG